MNTISTAYWVIIVQLLQHPVWGVERQSASYSIRAESTGFGGGAASGARFIHHGTVGPIAGLSGVSTAEVTIIMRSGFSSSDSASVSPGALALRNWRLTHFGTDASSGDYADLADYDRDGIPNLLEWAFGSNPTVVSTMKVVPQLSGATLTYTYQRSVEAGEVGAVFAVEWSDTLAADSWSSTGVAEQVIADDGVLQQVKATLPLGPNGKRYIRLKLTGPP